MMAQGDVFDLVQRFDKMRQGLGSGGGGVGRPMEKPRPVQEAYAHRLEQPAQGAASMMPSGPRRGALDLVDFGGRQFDRSVVGQVQALARQFPGLRLSSGYRDPQHNARVNGVRNSRHLTGRAADFSGSAKDMQEAAAWARMNGIPEVLVHNAGSGTHLHVGWGH